MKKLLLIAVCFVFTFNARASNQFPLNAFFYNTTEKQFILIDKSRKEFFLYKIENDMPKKIISYDKILLGEVKGDKKVEGDKKTPEGVYQIISFIPPERLHAKYGAGAFTLDYPNAYDKKLGKTGYGIWIHGYDETSGKQFTKGCVNLRNNQIKELKKRKIIKTFVIITKKADFASKNDYFMKKTELRKYIDKYLKQIKKKNGTKKVYLRHAAVFLKSPSKGLMYLNLKINAKSSLRKVYVDFNKSDNFVAAEKS